MRKQDQIIKIAVVDDSEFYNKWISEQIKSYTDLLALENKCGFELYSFSGLQEFENSSNKHFDVAIIDYYLGNGITGPDVLNLINQDNVDCKAVILSQNRNMNTVVHSKRKGFEEFVHKTDKYAIPRLCFFVESAVQNKMKASA